MTRPSQINLNIRITCFQIFTSIPIKSKPFTNNTAIETKRISIEAGGETEMFE